MLKKIVTTTACTSVFALGLTATPAEAMRHTFFFEAPPQGDIESFSGDLGFNNDGSDATLTLDIVSTSFDDFSNDFGAVDLIFNSGVGFSLFGDPANGDPATTLLTFDTFSDPFPSDILDLSAFLAGDVTATATAGDDIIPGLPGGATVAVNDVEFTKTPEPSATLAFLSLGLMGAGLKLRRKAKLN